MYSKKIFLQAKQKQGKRTNRFCGGGWRACAVGGLVKPRTAHTMRLVVYGVIRTPPAAFVGIVGVVASDDPERRPGVVRPKRRRDHAPRDDRRPHVTRGRPLHQDPMHDSWLVVVVAAVVVAAGVVAAGVEAAFVVGAAAVVATAVVRLSSPPCARRFSAKRIYALAPRARSLPVIDGASRAAARSPPALGAGPPAPRAGPPAPGAGPPAKGAEKPSIVVVLPCCAPAPSPSAAPTCGASPCTPLRCS